MEALARRCDGDPRIIKVLYWHQLPKHLQRKYAGRSVMGRVYALDLGHDEIAYLWSEAGLFEEAAWHYSRLLDEKADREVIALMQGVAEHGQAV